MYFKRLGRALLTASRPSKGAETIGFLKAVATFLSDTMRSFEESVYPLLNQTKMRRCTIDSVLEEALDSDIVIP